MEIVQSSFGWEMVEVSTEACMGGKLWLRFVLIGRITKIYLKVKLDYKKIYPGFKITILNIPSARTFLSTCKNQLS